MKLDRYIVRRDADAGHAIHDCDAKRPRGWFAYELAAWVACCRMNEAWERYCERAIKWRSR